MEVLVAFVAIAGALFLLDLWSHRRNDHAISLANAAGWSLVYIAGALLFAGFLYWHEGPDKTGLFLAGYVMEKVLSVDNLMVFVAIFAYFKIPAQYQHRVLYYGILGAIVFRLIFVAVGAGALQAFGPIVGLIFAAFVIWSAIAMWRGADSDEEVDYANQWYIRWAKRWLPFVNWVEDHRFFGAAYTPGKGWHRVGTPLLLCLVAIEISDVMFAFDSVPAVIAITQEPLLVYSAMIFAILGLRSLYFVLDALLRYLTRLGTAIIAVLFFIGLKLMAESLNGLGILPVHLPHISPMASMAVVFTLLAMGVVASIIWPEKEAGDDGAHNG